MARRQKPMSWVLVVKLATLVLLFMAVVAATPKSAFAEAATPLEVTLTADRGEYYEGDTVFITVTVKNTGSDVASASAYHVTLPDSLKEMDGQVLADELGDIAPGETKTVSLEVVALAPAGGETANTVTPVSYGTNSKTVVPETGDRVQGTAFVVMSSGVLVISGALVVVLAKKGKIGQLFSVMLVLGLSFGISCFTVTPAMAKEAEPASASFELSVNGKTEYVSVSVTCSLPENPGDSDGVVYRNDVIVIKGYEEDEGTYSFTDAQNTSGREVQIGDKIVLEIADDELDALMGTVTSVSKGAGVTVVTVTSADNLAFAVEDIDIDETVSEVSADQIELAEDVELANADEAPMSELKKAPARGDSGGDGSSSWKDEDSKKDEYDLGKLKFKLDKKIGQYGSGDFTVSYRPYVKYKFKWDWKHGVKDFKVGVGGEEELEGSLAIKNEVEIPLGHIPFPVKPVGKVIVDIYLVPSISGKAKISAKSNSYLGIKYNGNKVVNDSLANQMDVDAKLEGKVSIQLGIDATYKVLKVEVADMMGKAGPQLSPGMVDIRENGMICSNLNVDLVADITVGKHTDWLKKAHLSWNKKIWTEKNSPMHAKLHFEDGKLVDKCTYVKSEDKPEPEEPDPEKPNPGDAGDENKVEGGYFVEPEDEGYGSEIEWIEDPEPGILATEHLAKPFYLYAGQSITVSAAESYGTIEYCATEDTLVRETGGYEDDQLCGGAEFCGSIDGWSENPGPATLEVLSGRVEVCGISGHTWEVIRPNVSIGKCEIMPYPLRISNSDLTLRVGQTYHLTQDNDIDELENSGAELLNMTSPTWTSSAWQVAEVDLDTGAVTACKPGEANIICNIGGFKRYCKVKVI
ncbi:hypothetical protein HGI81_00240 [Olsenella sp. KGMB02461]|nr:hypothetical protein [Olsenella sp. KGMB02461]